MSDQMMEQAVRASRGHGMSSIKEVVSSWSDVARFLRDRWEGTTTLVSAAAGGAVPGDMSLGPAVSADGENAAPLMAH